jgi:hypothetical protein
MGVVKLLAVTVCLIATISVATASLYPGDYRIVSEYYTNPYDVDISTLPSLSDIPVDDPADGTDWVKIDLPPPCVSGDGGSTFIMVSKGTSNNIFVYMQGGGACTDYLTCNVMVTTLHPDFSQTSQVDEGIFNRTNELNPFRDWTFVYIPYSTGDVHSGNRVVEYYNPLNPHDSMVVYHVGFVNAVTAMRWVASQGGFEKIVIGGSSAGGYGTVMNFYSAYDIFNEPIVAIDDAGPGLVSKVDPAFKLDRTLEVWGWGENLPSEAMDYVYEKGEPIYGIGYVLDQCDECIFGLFEDQKDFTIGTLFLKYPGFKFRRVLLGVTSDLRDLYPDNFYRFLPYGRSHTVLELPRFYTEEICGTYVYEWVNGLISGNPKDFVEPVFDFLCR